MNFREHNLSAMVDHFASGCKKEKLFGLELEHFVVDVKTKRTLPYFDGVEAILKKFALLYGEPVYSNSSPSHIIGINGQNAAITLEPAAQLEISIAPSSDVSKIRLVYDEFEKLLRPILEEHDCELICVGYHPKSKVDELPLIPKARYGFMDSYFKTVGTRGKYMMKGTAATQVSIDYESEADFIKKFRVANIIGPFLSKIFDNTEVFEGQPYEGKLARTYIWNDVDADRSMVVAGALDKPNFGFYDYAEYIYNTPPIFILENGQEKFTGPVPASEIFANRAMTQKDIEHVISMAFPDVRLKTNLELRTVDSVPIADAIRYTKLLGLIFYDQNNLDTLYEDSLDVGNIQVADLKERLMNS